MTALIKKAFDIEYKFADGSERVFEGYGSTFGNKDLHGDIVVQGAFQKSLAGKSPAMLLHHDMHRPIGVWEDMHEDSKGLFVRGRLTEGVRDADEAYALMKDGAIHSMSIGFIPTVEEYDRKDNVNYIKEIDLWEVSLVTIPANDAAMVSAVKNADGKVDVRELERILRDAGLSRRDAKALLSEGISALQPHEADISDIVDVLKSFTQR